jgi:hypothetical protein
MSDHDQETEELDPQERSSDDDPFEEQEGKGYGDDEGEREQSFGDG